jgi:serine/threonine protein kinase
VELGKRKIVTINSSVSQMDAQDPTTWASYKGMTSALKKRVDPCLNRLDTTPALEEAKRIFGREFESAPTFSAGRKWLCIQLLSKPKSSEKNGLTVILRVRIPPAREKILSEAFMRNENAGFFREQINAKVLGEHMKSIRIPKIYHVSPWGSAPAEKAGYPFMLMERMGGNKLRDILRHKKIESFSKLDVWAP